MPANLWKYAGAVALLAALAQLLSFTHVLESVWGFLLVLLPENQCVPSSMLSALVSGFIFYNVGWFICVLDLSEARRDGEKDIGFIGEHYLGEPGDTIEMVLVCRKDLDMSPGKLALQCGHATVGIYRRLWRKNIGIVKSWEDAGQKKIILEVADEESMLAAQKQEEATRRAVVFACGCSHGSRVFFCA
mmetsp:Transcript_13973/g.48238  ORF Transcript_13973/g.48238 Transcript_13973/m.48238 type:complete len:189 (-) Transcript_13973:515-1081(-)